MPKMTIEDAAQHFGVSKEAIHNRVRRGSLESVVEDNIKYVILDGQQVKTSTIKRASGAKQNIQPDERYYKLLEEQNVKLQARVEVLEGETKTLREQKEQMLIEERIKIEEIYKQKDEQLKHILNALTSKFMLDTPVQQEAQNVQTIQEDHVEAELEEEEIAFEIVEEKKNNLISLKKYFKQNGYSEVRRKKVKDRFKALKDSDERVLVIDKKYYLDFVKYSYKDIL